MANQPKTPHRTIRVEHDLWEAARALAAQQGETVSDVVRSALQDYVAASRDR